MKTIVLDDDPTGTQSASGVSVLLDHNADLIEQALREADSVYVQTNSRALHQDAAVNLIRRIRDEGVEAGRRLGSGVRFVLRGDSTLRGHVFEETEVFLDDDSIMVFVPAFPDGGRTTTDGNHYVNINGQVIPAHESEYAADPVFPFDTSVLVDYVAKHSGRVGTHVPIAAVRNRELESALSQAEPGVVVVPDAETNADIRLIAAAIESASEAGKKIVVRSASPLAAELAGIASRELLEVPLVKTPRATLLVCGSHTAGASAQLEPIRRVWGEHASVSTAAALQDPAGAGEAAADEARGILTDTGLVVVATERTRSKEHGTLDHGEAVMAALVSAVQELLPVVDVVISKGGITSAEVARAGLGATSAWVLGQVLPGVSVWRMTVRDGRELLYVVVPGNVGGPDTLVQVLESLSVVAPAT